MLRRDGVSVEALVVPPRRYLAERRQVVERCVRAQPSVVHVHGARPDVLVAGVIRRAGFRVVSTVHGFTGGDLKNRFYEAMQRRALRRMDAVVAVSRPLSRELIDHGVPAQRMHVLPNAAPNDAERMSREEARAALGIAPHERVVGWVGRLTAEKGCDVFVAAMAVIDRADVVASIIGSGQQRDELVRLAGSMDSGPRLRWHGELPAAGRFLGAFDVFVMSSRTEGTPMVLFEAIQAGVPVVTTAVGGIPDVVSSEEALLVAPDDANALAGAIRRAVDDPAAAERRAVNAAARIRTEFSRQQWVARYSAVYRSALDSR
jgi:glycosyltransferase involved in cell wall biosynthesis